MLLKVARSIKSKIIYSYISKEMSSLYFGLYVVCPYSSLEMYKLDTQPLPLKYWDSCGSVHRVEFLVRSFEFTDNIQPKIQQ